MMNQNQHVPAGYPPPALPMHPQSRRQQEYHAYVHHAPPSPMHHPHAYPNYQHPSYFPHPPQQPQYPQQHQQQRWHNPYPPQQQQQQWMPPPQPPPQQQQHQHHSQQYMPPRSPMVVTSQPQYAQNMTPVTRHTPIPPPTPQQPAQHSPLSQRVQSQVPAALPSPVPTPKQDKPAHPPAEAPPHSRRESSLQSPLSLSPEHRSPHWPTLPWYSVPEEQATFPPRATPRRRRRQALRQQTDSVALPTREGSQEEEEEEVVIEVERPAQVPEETPSETSTIAAPSDQETPATSQAPSESEYTQVSTPATPAQAPVPSPKPTPTTQTHARRDTRTAIAVPNIPGLPKKASPSAAEKREESPRAVDDATPTPDTQVAVSPVEQAVGEEQEAPKSPPPPKAAPKSWAELLRTKGAPGAAAAQTNGATTNGTALPKSASLADALRQYSVQSSAAVSIIEPRGLVNTGNMCYMNSILQVLLFCSPFYFFLDQVRQRTVHSLSKSDTPLIDALIMFVREFEVVASADSLDGLRKMLGPQQLEQYGEPHTPEYVYDAIRKLDRFSGMRRGHQQDAEEFFGFLLESLHEECLVVMQGQQQDNAASGTATSPENPADDWLEVGPKQKSAITRTAGLPTDAPTPITKIFGGHLRSELRVPGLKDSVTLEPYKPLQLDIGAPHVTNILDALKSLTRTEALSGEFGGRAGATTAKKQVFIDTLPPVLILHLKRFQYENERVGTQKIWKKVGYPLELEIPKEVFPPSKRAGLAVKGGAPNYRLSSVVYHHGKSAAGGHYTVDVLRQDGRDWVRIDDTYIRRIRPEDVAEGGAEEDPKALARALESHKAEEELKKQRNIYEGLDEAEREAGEERPWSEVKDVGGAAGKRGWSAAVTTNGTATPKTPTTAGKGKEGKEGKVAYILLYERMS